MTGRCADCPAPEGTRCRGEAVPHLCTLAATRDDYRRLLAGRPDPRPRPPAYRRDPARVNVGLLAPTVDLVGGAERVHHDVCTGLDPARFHVVGELTPWSDREVAALALCDVVITWGLPQWREVIPPGPRVLLTSHMSCDWTVNVVRGDERADLLVAVSERAIEPFSPAGRARARVIPNVVAPGRAEAAVSRDSWRAAHGIPASAWLCLFLGRMAAEKRPEVAEGAVRAGADAWVALGGEGALRADLEPRAGPRVVYLGQIADVGSALGAADVLVQPSSTEGLSLASLEALAAGVPVIATPTGLFEYRPDLARLLPEPPLRLHLAAAVAADRADPRGTADRVARGHRYIAEHANHRCWVRAWEDAILSLHPVPPPPPPGPGTILAGWLGYAGLRATAGCGCKDLAARMDREPSSWSLDNMDLIVDSMKAEAARRGLPFVAPAARALVRRAVRVALAGGAP